MADIIDIAQLNFDTSKLTQGAEQARMEIDKLAESIRENRKVVRENNREINALTKENEDLAKSGKETSKEYKDNEKAIEKYQKEVEKATRVLLDQEKASSSLKNEVREYNKILNESISTEDSRQAALSEVDKVLSQEANTIRDLREQNKQLNTLRNNVALDTEEGAKALEALNQRLDENNKRIFESADGYSQQKMNIGNYRMEVEKTADELGITNTFLGKMIVNFTKTDDAADGGATSMAGFGASLKPAINGVIGLTRASLAFLATPIGGAIAAIALAVGAVTSALSSSEDATNKLSKAFAPLRGVVNLLTNALAFLGDLIIDRIVVGLENLASFVDSTVGKVSDALRRLGFSSAADAVDQYKDAVDEAAAGQSRLVELQQRSVTLSRENKVALSEERQALEEAKEARDDTNLTLEERLVAGEKVNKIIDKQIDRELELARVELDRARQELINGNKSAEVKDAIADAQAKINDLEADRAARQREETSILRSLQKEDRAEAERAADEAKRRSEEAQRTREEEIKAAIERKDKMLELFILQNEGMQESVEDEINFLRSVAETRQKILEEQLDNELITQEDYNIASLKLSQELTKKEAELIGELTDERLRELSNELQAKQNIRGRFDQERVNEETKLLDEIKTLEEQKLKERLDAGLVTVREYDQARKLLEEEHQEGISEIQTLFEEQRREDAMLQAELDRELRVQDEEEEFDRRLVVVQTQFEAEQEALEELREQGLINYDNYLKKQELLEKQHAEAVEKIEEEKQQAKLNAYANAAGQIKGLLGEETAAGKFFAIAQATINTYLGATEALKLPFPANLIALAATLSTGFAQVGKIKGIGTTFAYGGFTGEGKKFERAGVVHKNEMVFTQEDVRMAGGAQAVERMRPTSKWFDGFPTGSGGLDSSKDYELMAHYIEKGAKAGSEEGTKTGIVEHSENIEVREAARF